MPLVGDGKREYQRKWIANRRAEFFKDKSCAKCGSTESLELDHIDRLTKVSNSIWSWSQVRREEELAKCQVLCSDCHLKKTSQEAKDLLTYLEDGVCGKGHQLHLVGLYKSNNNGKLSQNCSYCHHVARSIARGYTTKTLEEWIKFRNIAR